MKGREDTTTQKPDTASFENPADLAALEAIKASEAAGGDPFGDLDDDDGTSTAAPPTPPPADATDPDGEGNTADAAPKQPADTGTAEELAAAQDATDEAARLAAETAAAAAAPAPAAPAPVPLKFNTKTPAELQAAQTALLDEQDAAFEKYSDGTMTAKEYSAVQRKVTLELGELTAQHALLQASQQTVQQSQLSAIDSLKARAKSVLDYDADPEAVEEFNRSAAMLASDPKNASLTPSQLFDKAHGLVLHMRGITPTATPAAPAPPAPREDMKGPITLRGVPAAAMPNTTGGVNEELSRLNGLDFEERIGAMPRAQRDAYLDS